MIPTWIGDLALAGLNLIVAGGLLVACLVDQQRRVHGG